MPHASTTSPAPLALTGVTGFIGGRLLRALVEAGTPVRVLARRPDALSSAPPGCEVVTGGLDDHDALARLVDGARAVVHLAGAIRGARREDFDDVNVVGTRALVAAMRSRAPHAPLLLVSSLAAREPGLSWYAASKHAAEAVVRDSGLGWTILRPPAVYGPGDPALAPLWRGLARGWLLRAGPAHARFSLVHVDDLVEAMLRLLQSAPDCARILALHDGRDGGWDWRALAEAAAAQRGAPVRIVPVPAMLLRAVAGVNLAAARVLRYAPILTPPKVRELRHADWSCDNLMLSEVLGWAPRIPLSRALTTLPGWNRP